MEMDDDAALVWHTIKSDGEEPSPRVGASSSIINGEVYVFGGCARNVVSAEERLQPDGTTSKLDAGYASNELFQGRIDGSTCSARWSKVEPSGDKPCGRWRHTASEVGKKIFIFGGMVDDRERLNDLFLYDSEEKAWRDPKPRGALPAPRSCHTTNYIEAMDKLLVYGGYGGDGRLYADIEAFHIGTLTWAPLPTKGALPPPRFDHSASLAGSKLIICGGRNCEAPVQDLNVLDVETLTWEVMKSLGESPVPLFSHVACAIPSALSHKLFVFGGREGPFKYKSVVHCMDSSTLTWMEPQVETAQGMDALPHGRESASHVFDPRSGHLFIFGGWNSSRLNQALSLDCTGIVGPPYAALGTAPTTGPLSGGRECIVEGLNFIAGKIEVKFTNKTDEATVAGKIIDASHISCTTPSFEAHGAQTVFVKVAINGQLFTVNRVSYNYYDDTEAGNCVAYGPGLNSCTLGKPAKFVVRAIDTKKLRRTSGADHFEVVAVWNKGSDHQLMFKGRAEDHKDGLYTMTYIPKAAGDYHIQVYLMNSGKKCEIRGSPFLVTTTNPWRNAPLGGTSFSSGDVRTEIRTPGSLFTFAANPRDTGAVNVFDMKTKSWHPSEMQPKAKAPKPCEGTSTVLIGEDRMLSYGGMAKNGIYSGEINTLVKDGELWDWTQPMVNGTTPTNRKGHAAVVHKKMMLVSGGEIDTVASDTCLDMHMLDCDQGMSVVEWMPVAVTGDVVPAARTQHGMISDGAKVFIFGGIEQLKREEKEVVEPAADAAPAEEEGEAEEPEEGDEEEAPAAEEPEKPPAVFLNDIAIATVDRGTVKWAATTQPTGPAPEPRINMQLSVIDGKLCVMGGVNLKEEELNDMWCYDTLSNTWTCVYDAVAPPSDGPVKTLLCAGTNEILRMAGDDGTWDSAESVDLRVYTVEEKIIGETQRIYDAKLKEIEEFVNNASKVMATKVEKGDLQPLLKVMSTLSDVAEQSARLDFMVAQFAEVSNYLELNGVDPGPFQTRLDSAQDTWGSVQKNAPKIKTNIRSFQDYEGRKIKEKIVAFADEADEFRDDVRKSPFFIFDTGSLGAYAAIREMDKRVSENEKKVLEQTKLSHLFECSEEMVKPTQLIADSRHYTQLAKLLWDCSAMVDSYFDAWKTVSWADIDTEDYEEVVKRFKQECRQMPKEIRQEFPAFEGLRDYVNDMGAALPCIGDLKQDCMRRRHWVEVKEQAKSETLDVDKISELKFENLLTLGLHNFVDEVGEIVDRAQKEEKIEKNLAQLKITWATQCFELYQHNDSDVYLVRVSEETFETLEDNQVLVQNMAASRFIGQFADEVNGWQTSLATVAEVLQIISEIQRTWSYLEDLFIGSEEVKRELPEDAERFVGIDKDVKTILAGCQEEQNLVTRCNHDGLYAWMEKTQHQLELCEKSLQDFMEAKKRSFPRFYFVSSKDLLDILSNGNRPDKVMGHIPKIFQAITQLDLVETDGIFNAQAMISPEKEVVPFAKKEALTGKVEMWLHKVINAMREALRVILKASNVSYPESNRTDFICEFQGQIVITTCQTNWCLEVENAFDELNSGKATAMSEYNVFQGQQITDLIAKVRTKLEKNDRRKVMNIITLDAHARDMIMAIVDQNISSKDSFQWQCQLRYRWDEGRDTSVINICDAEFGYAFEYLGNGARLVITPLTDRLYITATQALHLVMGCAPAGPAGTGKTETTKDLAAQLGVAIYVFNCSDQMDYHTVGDIFKGLASSGSWGCFDEFNRITPEVLSVCSVQFKAVLDGVRAHTGFFNFPGEEELVLNYEVGAFITMNPGYLGRTELPEGLKALFRPVTVMVPDFELICENMLMAEGYEGAKDLAHKFVTLYFLCRDLLSKQLHYDWGLRAIKSVLVVAGAFKREEPEVAELALLMRALRDFNIPKIPMCDMVVFMGLIGDLFPGMNIPAKKNLELTAMLLDMMPDRNLIPDDEFILKVCQFEELLAIRHTVMLLGSSGAGKSTVCQSLGNAWTKSGVKTLLRDINPKVIISDDFYGVISLATREWRDGLMSVTMRDLSRMPDTNPKWIVLDGDLDAIWIESMNSVMDDNKLLTLASNERIPLLPHMRLVLEIRDLVYASPATVSRAGILYISDGQQHQWYIESWIRGRELDTDEQKTILRNLFLKYTEPCLDWLAKNAKALTPVINFNMCQTLCHLLNGLLGEDNKNFQNGAGDKMQYETYFCFACVWAFGGPLAVKDGEDYRHKFNRWWRGEWRPIKFPDAGSVFDYYVDQETVRYCPWTDITETIDYDGSVPMNSVTVPTQETTGLAFWMNRMMDLRVPLLYVGYSGCGKTSIVLGELKKLDADEKIFSVINFNYFTDSYMLVKILDGPLTKKAGKNYGPPGNKKLVYFVDDLNMPKLDPYNTQTPIALLRQHFDYGHWYDLEKLQIKNVGNCQYVSCMNPASGSFIINPRLLRHFVTLAVGFPHQDSLMAIYSTFLNGYLRAFDPSITERITKLISAGLELHTKVSSTFRKTAIKFHYEFTVRHVTTMFQGLMAAKKDIIKTGEKIVKLWLHEANRTYGDLLMSEADMEAFALIARTAAKKYFPNDKEDVIFPTPNIFCYFAKGLTEKSYSDILNYEVLSDLEHEALRDYNDQFSIMDLVLFEDAMTHVCRINRVVETGHALLVGVGGSGKQSLSRLASFISGNSVQMITIAKGYSSSDLKLDIAQMYLRAGRKDEQISFMMTDSQIVDEKFLVFINDLLASGDIPDLFPPDEKEEVINGIRNEVKAAGIVDTNEACYDFFITKVKSNLHMILCFSPVGEAFRVRARRFPALVNNTCIDWFHAWPADALQSVSEKFLCEIELGTQEVKDAIIKFMPFSFVEVNAAGTLFLDQERRYAYTTPKSFLELIDLYKKMLQNKRDEMQSAVDRLQAGLDKLQGTAKKVGELEEFLKIKSVEVEEKILAAEILGEKVGKEKAICGEQGAAATIEAAKCDQIKVEVTQKREDCERDLAAALPAVAKAMAALDTINKKDLGELKALKKPPGGIDDVMAAVMILLSPEGAVVKDRSWQNAQKSMKEIDKFMEKLFSFKDNVDAEVVPQANFKAVRPYLKLDDMDVDVILRKSKAAAGLCGWVINITIYFDIVSDVEPKKRMLAAAEEQLNTANTTLKRVTEEVAALNEKLANLNAEFDRVMKEKDETVAESNKMAKKLEMAQRLINALASEGVRWGQGVGILQGSLNLLPGDVLVSAAFVSYVGPFSNTYRTMLMDEKFMPYIAEFSIPCSPNPDPVNLLTDEAKIAGWANDGLPADRVSTENGCLVTSCVRWPLIIDPQLQGIVWIKTRESANSLLITRLGQKGMLDKLERAIENGEPVLIENLQESIDAVLGPIVGRQFFKKNRKLHVALGDKEVEVHKLFKLYLHTKLANPHFPPEIQAETTLVNFTVTEDGLTDQLLARVVKKERPDLEETKTALTQQQNGFKVKLKEIEDSLLMQLATAEGDLTENVELIENLEESKRVSTDIEEKASIAAETEIAINEAREAYRPVAIRGALLYFMLGSLGRIHSLYLYSLSSFVAVFERAIDQAEENDKLERRLANLLENITYSVWHFTRRGLFEKNKLMVVVQLLVLVLKKSGKLDPDELNFLLLAPGVLNPPDIPDAIANFINPDVWGKIQFLRQVSGLSDLVDDVVKSAKLWRAWMDDEKAEKSPLPPKMEGKTQFQKLCIMRAMRPDRITNALTDWCTERLGGRYVEEPPFNMQEVFAETTVANPVFFVLFPGVNPYGFVEDLGKIVGYTEAGEKGKLLRRVSMGQGQEPVAEAVIEEYGKDGGWVFLDNIHLMQQWLPKLERALEVQAEIAHENFRVFLSAEPHPFPLQRNIPPSTLEAAIKIINMPPSSLKANMRRAFAQFTQDTYDQCTKSKEVRGMIFSLAFFHACLVGRHKFGSQGWSRAYGFNFGDLVISSNVIQNYLNNNEEVPWADVRYIIGEVMYGGHITDRFDRRVDIAYLSEMMTPECFTGAELAPGFKSPECDKDWEYYREYIETEFPMEHPNLFGLHSNAEIGYLLSSGDALFSIVLEISGGGGGGGSGAGDNTMQMIEDFEGLLPEDFDEITLDQRVTDRNPYVCVVLQEVARMNILMQTLKSSLGELKLGLQGALNMSDAMEALQAAMGLNRVAALWVKYSYPSLKTLGSWFTDMLLRTGQLIKWCEGSGCPSKTVPMSLWISALFNPMAYITAVLQATARAGGQPLDQMEVWTDISEMQEPEELTAYPEDGMYIHGLCMEGARWDMKKGMMAESIPKDLHPRLPLVLVRGVLYADVDKTGIFDCPVYITTKRGDSPPFGVFTFIATLKTNVAINKWVLAGAAIMMSDDIA